VAQDGSGTHRTIQAAVNALAAMGHNRPARVIIHVKSGIYNEKVQIGQKLHDVMLVGEGIDKTIVTGNRNVAQGSTTMGSATFGKTKNFGHIGQLHDYNISIDKKKKKKKKKLIYFLFVFF